MKIHSTIDENGMLPVPPEIQEKLGLAPGDFLEFIEEGDTFIVRRYKPRGCLWGFALAIAFHVQRRKPPKGEGQ